MSGEEVTLPPPRFPSVMLEETLRLRRSEREYTGDPLTAEEVSVLLWAAGGWTVGGGCTIPSAGGIYPLRLYAVCGDVVGVPIGVYRYLPDRHVLAPHLPADVRGRLARASLEQPWVGECAFLLAVAALPAMTAARYGGRGMRYVLIEAGHAAQNVYLAAAALGLGTVAVGAFEDDVVASVLELAEGEIPLYLLPVGRPFDRVLGK